VATSLRLDLNTFVTKGGFQTPALSFPGFPFSGFQLRAQLVHEDKITPPLRHLSKFHISNKLSGYVSPNSSYDWTYAQIPLSK